MTNWTCEAVRDAYPDALNGRLDGARAEPIRAHVASCEECRVETELLARIRAHIPQVPSGLHDRVLHTAVAPALNARSSRRVLAMAATVTFVVIGGSVLVRNAGSAGVARPVGFVSVENAMLTGKASLDDFSVEELEQLLKEIES